MRILFNEVAATLKQKLINHGCDEKKAEAVAYNMALNSLQGTYSHGINRFARLIGNIDSGIVKLEAEPTLIAGFGAVENYDGNLGLGVTNALFATDRAISLAESHGIGLVALRNTNHWMRAATYGLRACDAGMSAICFTNTIPNMPAWGAVDSRLGNNPIMLAFPREKGHLVCDMAMSQFSYGALEVAKIKGSQMPIDAGYDKEGNLSRNPAAVLESRRPIPTGYWKGAAMSQLLDIFAGALSLGRTTSQLNMPPDEHGVSQTFIIINHRKIAPKELSEAIADSSVDFTLASVAESPQARIAYPGLKAKEAEADNRKNGIPVDEKVWEAVLAL